MTRQPIGLHAPTHFPGGSDPLAITYVVDILLDAPATEFTFDGLPLTLTFLELVWSLRNASSNDDSADSVVYANLNDTFASPAADYWWNLSLQNQQGPLASQTDASTSENGHGIGIGLLGTVAGEGWSGGSVKLPGYTGTGNSQPLAASHGMFDYDRAGNTPDVFVAGGFRQDVGPVTSVVITAWDAATGMVQQTFDTGSRVTLVGFPVV